MTNDNPLSENPQDNCLHNYNNNICTVCGHVYVEAGPTQDELIRPFNVETEPWDAEQPITAEEEALDAMLADF